VKTAVWFDKGTVPSGVGPSKNVIFPLAEAPTLAVSVTVWPNLAGLGLTERDKLDAETWAAQEILNKYNNGNRTQFVIGTL
jgi:hypothetical protein